MFYFQQMFETALSGIDSSGILVAVVQIANSILVLAALFGVYEAYSRGGDARALGTVAVRYLLLGLVIVGYRDIFRGVNTAFAQLATTISPNDFLSNFMDQAYAYYQATPWAWWNIVPGGLAAAVSLLLQLAAAAIFPITYAIFSLLYAMYGAILYVCGPMVIALYPSLGVSQLARTYLVNLMIFQAWGIIYAVLAMLLTAINASSLNAVFSSGSIWSWFQGSTQAMLLALSSILFSLAVALIPFLAKRIVSGEVGSSMFAVAHAAMTAIATTKLVAGGGASGFGAASRGSGVEAGGATRGGESGSGPSSVARSSQRAPAPPTENASSHAPAAPPDGVDARARVVQPQATGAAVEESSVSPPASSAQAAHASDGRHGRGQSHAISVRHAIGYGMGYAAGSAARWGQQILGRRA